MGWRWAENIGETSTVGLVESADGVLGVEVRSSSSRIRRRDDVASTSKSSSSSLEFFF